MPSEQTKERQLAVTDKQARLVDTLVASGCSITEAAREAGYASGESGRVTASKALRLPHVQAYMMNRITDAGAERYDCHFKAVAVSSRG